MKDQKMNTKLKMNLQTFAEEVEKVEEEKVEEVEEGEGNQTIVPHPQQQFTKPVEQVETPDNTQMISELKDLITGLSTNMESIQSQVSQQREKTPKQINAENEELLERLNTNAGGVLNEFAKRAREEAIKEMSTKYEEERKQVREQLQNIQWKDAVRSFVAENPNSVVYAEQMNKLMAENPNLIELAKKSPSQALNASYKMAVGSQLMGQDGNIVDGIMNNEELLTQILSNPDVKKRIIEDYTSSLNSTTPPIIGGNASTQPITITPENKPKTLEQGRASALARVRQYEQNQV